jgi:hypothetical protein
LEAVEVWRWQDGAASRVASLPGTYGSLAVGVWQDDAAPAHPAYRIVLVFAHGQREQPPDEAAGYLGGEGLPRPSLNVKDPGLTAPAAAPGPAAAWLLLALVALARPRR